MSLQSAEMEYASLGEYIRETRTNLGFDLVTVAEKTKISVKILQAIEDNDFAALPAEAFARGFYVLYAKMLSLDAEEVLQMYTLERPNRHKSGNIPTLPKSKLAQEVGHMAERPTFVPLSFFGLILLLLLLLGGFLCWYFSWNPAIYLSQKLRNLERNPQRIEQVLESRFESDIPEPIFKVARWQKARQNTHRNLFKFPSPSNATAAVMQTGMPEDFPPITAQTSKYFVNAEFSGKTELTLAIDDLPEQNLFFKNGESISWQATEKIAITLPGTTRTKLTLNDAPLDLPQQHNGSITISLPEHLLQ
jgi:cytoskeleton protein RodZ